MSRSDLHDLLDEALKVRGRDSVEAALQSLVASPVAGRVLTIIANAGVHQIPAPHLRGEVYEASRGDWDATSQESLIAEISRILLRLVLKLKSAPWERIYLIPTGHPVLSLQIKAMVYRILRLNTIDLYYKAGTYLDVDIDQRAIALDGSNGA